MTGKPVPASFGHPMGPGVSQFLAAHTGGRQVECTRNALPRFAVFSPSTKSRVRSLTSCGHPTPVQAYRGHTMDEEMFLSVSLS